MKDEKIFRKKVRFAMESRGLLQKFVAKSIGVHQTRLCQILNGHRSVSKKERTNLENLLSI